MAAKTEGFLKHNLEEIFYIIAYKMVRKVGFEAKRSIESTLLLKRRCGGSTRFLPKTTFVQMEKRLSERLDAANLAGAAIITSLHLKAENFCHCSRLQLSFKFFDTLWSILPITSRDVTIGKI